MARRVVSVIRTARRTAASGDPVLDANAYAIAEDVLLQIVLDGDGVERAVASADEDLRALVENGVAVHVDADALGARGLDPGDLVGGVTVTTPAQLTELLGDADAVLTW